MRSFDLKSFKMFWLIFLVFLFMNKQSTGQEIQIENDALSMEEIQNGLKGMLDLLKKGEKDSAKIWFKNNYFLLHQFSLLTDSAIVSLYNAPVTNNKQKTEKITETNDSSTVITPELHAFIINELKKTASKLGEPPDKILPVDFVNEVEKYINLFSQNETYRSFFQSALNRSKKYVPAFKKYFLEKGFPEEILYFVIVESGFDANSISKAGAAGMFQFMPGTARDYGLQVNEIIDERFSAVKSAKASAAYLKDLYLELGSISLALCSYNSGAAKTRSALKELENVQDRNFWILREKSTQLKKETREYIPQIYASIIMAKQENNKKFGFSEDTPISDSSFSVFYLSKPVDISLLSNATGIIIDSLYALNTDLSKNQKFTPADENDYPLFVPRSFKEKANFYLKGLLGNKKFDGSDEPPQKIITESKSKIRKTEKKKPTFNPEFVQSKEIFNEGDSLIYNVQRANTLHMIARIFRVNSDSILVWNGLRFKSIMRNQKLKIISPQKITRYYYKLPEKSTLKMIAEEFNVNFDDLKKTNRSKSGDLSPGEVLVIYSF